MNIIEKIKNLGWGFLGIIMVFALILLALFFIKGGLWLSTIIYPWLVLISIIILAISIFILLPLAFFKKTRGASATGLLIASYVFGATAWIWSFILAYIFWGFLGLFIGLFIGGVGVVPIAMLASMFNGEWGIFGELVFIIIITFSTRFLALYIVKKAE